MFKVRGVWAASLTDHPLKEAQAQIHRQHWGETAPPGYQAVTLLQKSIRAPILQFENNVEDEI